MEAILYGAGSDIYTLIQKIKELKITPLCICDGDPKKWGTYIEEIEIISPKEISSYNAKTIFITASLFDSIYQSLQANLGREIDNYKIYTGSFVWFMLVNVEYNDRLLEKGYSFITAHENEIKNIYSSDDTLTQEILEYIIRMRKSKSYFCDYITSKGMQYIEGYFYKNEIPLNTPKTIIDIGAYIGDTVDEFYDRWENSILRYYAFEPNEDNYNLLQKKAENEKYKNMQAIPKALGSQKAILTFGKSLDTFGVIYNENSLDSKKIEVDTLDNQNLSIEGELIIKMDVEGLELDILKGASNTIKKYNPCMAICVYHRIEDIYAIPMFLNSIGCNYKYLLRSGVHTHLLALPKHS